jgi:hypothetical protein
MNFISKEGFDKNTLGHEYWKGRWSYVSEVSKIARQLNPENCWEIGAGNCPISKESFKTDIVTWGRVNMFLDFKSKVPFLDKSFDLTIALQVWEHLEGLQSIAFSELRRVSKNTILSFPFMWECPKDPIHHQINYEQIAKWTNYQKPQLSKTIKCEDGQNRIIYVF